MTTTLHGDLAAYQAFLQGKADFHHTYGHPVTPDQVNPILKPHQRAIVQWAVEGGRRAIFAAFGLGKTLIQLEVLRLTLGGHGRALIVLPLGVRQEFMAASWVLNIPVRFIRRTEEIAGDGIYLTNYESVRDGRLDPNEFQAASLDEASVLRSYGSKTYQEFLTLFDQVPHRFVATATPSPNRYKELIHYAGFLGVMDTGQALTRFFQRDSTKANNLTLYPHKEREFFLWLNTWAVFVQKPSDLGFPDDGYLLPPLDIRWHKIPVDHMAAVEYDRDGQGHLIRGGAMGVTQSSREKRDTLEDRISQLMGLIDEHLGSSPRVQPQVLREESRTAVGRAEGTREAELPGEPGGVSRAVEAVEVRESGEVPGGSEGIRRKERGEAAPVPEGLLRGEPVEDAGAISSTEAGQGVRADGGRVRGDARHPDGPVPDLRGSDESSSGGSRPRDGYGSGSAVPAVQRGDRSVPGRSEDLAARHQVPEQIVVWCDLNAEQDAIERACEQRGLTYSSVHGGLDVDEAERRLARWKNRETAVLIGKPVQLGSGVNLQQCNRAVFAGVTYKFNDLIQAVHRIQRFGQTRPCVVSIIYAESEAEVVRTLREKWTQHDELTGRMSDVIRTHGLNHLSITDELVRSIGVAREEAHGEGWLAAHNDCVPETMAMESESVDLVVTSIPFANHYEYTPSYNDFGHTDDNAHFWAQMDFLTPQLHRVLRPGRIYACHVKDRILFGNVTGAGIPTVSPFHAEALFHGRRHGFDYMGMITIVTDVVRENNQTYRLGWSEMAKDGTKMGVGSPEYVLLFHKPQTDRSKGYADIPVTHDKAVYTRARWQVDAHAFWRSSGDRHLTPEELIALPVEDRSRLFTEQTLREIYDHTEHVQVGEELDEKGALPATFMSLAPGSWSPWVWHDVNRMLTLNTEQSQKAQALHVCPLQFDIVDRLIERYSNPGDLVYDPFGGLSTVALRALRLGRRGRTSELNADYWRDGVAYLRAEERAQNVPTLFDMGGAA